MTVMEIGGKMDNQKGQDAVRPFKILSIDGGGIRGLYSAIILEHLEKKYGPIVDYFDLICGTSTGGIISLGLSIGIPAKDIVGFYENEGKKIFPSGNVFIRTIHSLKKFVVSKYSNKQLRNALQEVFGDHVMNDSKCYLCIPSTDIVKSEGVIFKTTHSPNYYRDGNLKMVDVALATSAAPTYLPITGVQGVAPCLVDGGIWVNNPTVLGIVEAITHFSGSGKDYDVIDVLSIDNLATNLGWDCNSNKNPWSIKWLKNIFNLVIQSQGKAVHNIANILFNNNVDSLRSYVRICESNIPKSDIKYLKDLDRADNKALGVLRRIAESGAPHWLAKPEIQTFFENKVQKKTFLK
jgi:patatin-like phospholipase/acyl hydrolase